METKSNNKRYSSKSLQQEVKGKDSFEMEDAVFFKN